MANNIIKNSLENHWMPFTDNRGFKTDPRLITEASGVYMTSHKNTKIIDGSSGLFCSPAGHCHPKIIEAVHNQLKKNTYTSPFGMGHPASFELADKVSELTPEEMNHVFFVNSGSEAIDTALKIIMSYNSATGQNRHRFVSRERAYHGVNIGGVSFDGSANINLPGVNASGNQDTSGNAATATTLETARNIGGVSFNGGSNIDLPGVNTAGNQDTSGTAAIGTSVTVTANNTANETVYLTFVDGATGTQGIETDTGLTYNPSTGNLGASIFTGTATSAQYADLAEMYATDEKISAGTVVMFAGAGKVKPCNDENCRRVAGIVSTDPAYLMNSACEGVPLAISGRVPCRVIGPVEAGDSMVSAGNGMAMTNNDAKSGTIIGKAIEENVNGEGIIEILAMMM